MDTKTFDPLTTPLKPVTFSTLQVGDAFFFGGWVMEKIQLAEAACNKYNVRTAATGWLGFVSAGTCVWVEDLPPVVRLKDLVPGEFCVYTGAKETLVILVLSTHADLPHQAVRLYRDLVDHGTSWCSSNTEVSRIPNPFLKKEH